jgi:hypothetical protein
MLGNWIYKPAQVLFFCFVNCQTQQQQRQSQPGDLLCEYFCGHRMKQQISKKNEQKVIL